MYLTISLKYFKAWSHVFCKRYELWPHMLHKPTIAHGPVDRHWYISTVTRKLDKDNPYVSSNDHKLKVLQKKIMNQHANK